MVLASLGLAVCAPLGLFLHVNGTLALREGPADGPGASKAGCAGGIRFSRGRSAQLPRAAAVVALTDGDDASGDARCAERSRLDLFRNRDPRQRLCRPWCVGDPSGEPAPVWGMLTDLGGSLVRC